MRALMPSAEFCILQFRSVIIQTTNHRPTMAAKGKKSAKVVEPPKPAPVAKGRLFGAQLGNEVPKIITLSLSHLRENGPLLC